MASFPGFYLTNLGMELQAKAQAGVNLVYTKMTVGDGTLAEGQGFEGLTGLIRPALDLGIDSVTTPGDGTARLKAVLSNQGITTGFFVREIGIFAEDPDIGEILYAYTNAGTTADYLPETGGATAVEKNIEAIVSVGNAENISIIIPSENYATKEDLMNYTLLSTYNNHVLINRLWQPQANYAVGDVVYSNNPNADSYKYMECTAAGTTAAIEPSWPAVNGTVIDGTVTWRVLDLKGATANMANQLVKRDASGNFSAGTITAELDGNATSASKLEVKRQLSLTGDAAASLSFDGSANVSSTLTLTNSGVTASTYRSVTVDAKGRVTAGTNPTTLAGYGITDAAAANHTHTAAAIGAAPTAHASTATTYGVSSASNYGHAKASSAAPLVAGTAAAGTDNGLYAREGHVHPAQTTITGNAGTATKLATARTINGVAFDGTANITIADSTKAPTSHASTATTYGVSSATNYGHAMASTAVPLVAGTGAAGTDNGKYAREGHVHPAQTTITGNAGTATKLATARTISLTGAVTGSVNFDGSGNVSLTTSATGATLGFTQSLATNGWTKLPNGLIIQWGVNTSSTSGTTYSFPITFPNAVFSITSNLQDTSVGYEVVPTISIVSTSQFIVRKGSGTGVPIGWIAIGY